MSRRASALEEDGGPPEKARAHGAGSAKADAGDGEAADQAKGGSGAAVVTPAVLTIVVTGNNEPIAQAEVTLKLPSSAGEDRIGFTDAQGEVIFDSPGKGTAKVRIIVAGWKSMLREFALESGSQRVTVPLTALPDDD